MSTNANGALVSCKIVSGKIDVIKDNLLLMIPNFLEKELCSTLCDEIALAKQYFATTLDYKNKIGRKEKLPDRPNVTLDISSHLHEDLERKILEIKPKVEKHFSIELGKSKVPSYVIYQTGDFLDRHADATPKVKFANGIPLTQIVIIIFLNDNIDWAITNDEAPTYGGGKLTIFGLIKSKAFEDYGYPLNCKAGTLVAFPSTCLHEVTKVTSGTRYVVSSGYY